MKAEAKAAVKAVEQDRMEQANTKQAQTEQGETGQAKPDAPKAEPVGKRDPARPEPVVFPLPKAPDDPGVRP
jgi:hypothetical protein